MKVLLCAISKNDEEYILEWVNHYLSIGITHIIIYNNSIVDNYSDILKQYINDNLVTVDNCVLNKEFINKEKNFNAQTYVYTKCYNENYMNYDFICFFDMDEFIEFENKRTNIISFLHNKNFDKFNVIRLCWKIYDDNNIIVPKTFSVNQFLTPSKNTYQNRVCKSILRTNIDMKNKKISAHGVYNILSCDALGNLCWNKEGHDNIFIGEKPILHKCWLNHYRYKTIYEYINKMKLMNESNLSEYTLDYFFTYNEKTPEKLEYIKSLGIDYEYK